MVKSRRSNEFDDDIVNGQDWLSKAGDLSQAVSLGVANLLTKSGCKMCAGDYLNAQVAFEERQEDYKTTMAKVWLRSYRPSMEVELYRQFLFDEESVVESVTERDEATLNAFEQAARRLEDDVTISTQKS